VHNRWSLHKFGRTKLPERLGGGNVKNLKACQEKFVLLKTNEIGRRRKRDANMTNKEDGGEASRPRTFFIWKMKGKEKTFTTRKGEQEAHSTWSTAEKNCSKNGRSTGGSKRERFRHNHGQEKQSHLESLRFIGMGEGKMVGAGAALKQTEIKEEKPESVVEKNWGNYGWSNFWERGRV